MSVAAERIRRLGSHLESAGRGVADWLRLEMAGCSRARKAEFQTERLAEFIRGKHMEVQEKVYKYLLSNPELQTPVEISMNEHRELCMRQLLGLVREAGISPFRYPYHQRFSWLLWMVWSNCVSQTVDCQELESEMTC